MLMVPLNSKGSFSCLRNVWLVICPYTDWRAEVSSSLLPPKFMLLCEDYRSKLQVML